MTSSLLVGTIPPTEGLRRANRKMKGELALRLSRDIQLPPSSDICPCSWFLGLQSWTRTYTVISPLDAGSHNRPPDFQASIHRLNYSTGFPQSPTCRWQMWDPSTTIIT